MVLKKMIFHSVWRLEGKEYYQVFKSIYPFIFPFHRLYELYIYIYMLQFDGVHNKVWKNHVSFTHRFKSLPT